MSELYRVREWVRQYPLGLIPKEILLAKLDSALGWQEEQSIYFNNLLENYRDHA